MAQAKGSLGQLLIDFEETYGAPYSPITTVKMPFNSFDLKSERNLTPPNTITGARDSKEPIAGNRNVSGSAVIPVDINNIGYWLKALLGTPSTNAAGDPIFVHTFSTPDDVPSMVMELGFVDITQYFKYTGVKVNTFGIETGGDGELVANMDLLGSTLETSGSTMEPSTELDLAFSRFTNFQAALTEGGSALSNAKTFGFTMGNNLDEDGYVIGGGGIRGALPAGLLGISGTLTTLFEDLSLFTKAIASTETALVLTFTNGDYSLVCNFPEAKFMETAPTITTPAGVVAQLDWQAYLGDGSASTIVLTNGIADYDRA